MKKLLLSIIVVMIFASGVSAESKHNFVSSSGFVPDAETAVAIAVAVWKPIYGKEQIEKQVPYHAQLIDGIWIVEGSYPKSIYDPNAPVPGGAAIAEISKLTGEVLRVSHSK
jgi:hypothetical protein